MEQLSPPVRAKKGVMGHLVIHSTPSALRPHIEWAIQNLLGSNVTIEWKVQPRTAGTYRSTIKYLDRSGVAASLATTLRSWHYLRFEIIESDSTGGEMFRYTPDLGLHRASIDGSGAVVISEHLITSALARSFDEESLRFALESALGKQWDDELEHYRSVELEEVAALKAI